MVGDTSIRLAESPVLSVLQPCHLRTVPCRAMCCPNTGLFPPHSKHMFSLCSLGLSLASLRDVSFRPKNYSNVNLD